MRIRSLSNRVTNLETVLVPQAFEPLVITLNFVDSNRVTVSTREIVINPPPAAPVKLGRSRRY